MKQLNLEIETLQGKKIGIRKITQLNWDVSGNLTYIVVDFMEDNNSNDYLGFFKEGDKFISINKNLIGKIL